MTLPLQLVTATLVTCVCADCLTADSSGGHAPEHTYGESGAYGREAGRWLCARCHRSVWGAYLQERRDRVLLIEVSGRLGYPCRMADVEAYRERGREQLDLLTWRAA